MNAALMENFDSENGGFSLDTSQQTKMKSDAEEAFEIMKKPA